MRLVQLSQGLSFRQSIAYLQRQLSPPPVDSDVLEKAAAFYQFQLHRHPEAVQYLQQRGLCDAGLIDDLFVGRLPILLLDAFPHRRQRLHRIAGIWRETGAAEREVAPAKKTAPALTRFRTGTHARLGLAPQ